MKKLLFAGVLFPALFLAGLYCLLRWKVYHDA